MGESKNDEGAHGSVAEHLGNYGCERVQGQNALAVADSTLA
jgi:hypothetical protein